MGEAEIQAMIKENAALREENRLLRKKVDLLIRQMFGKKSEKLSPGQLEMLLCGEDSPEEPPASVDEPVMMEAPKKATPPKERRPRYPEDLPVEETVIDPEEVEQDPTQWRQIGQEASEQLDYEPGRFIRRRTVRRTWVRRNDPDGVPLTAALPAKLKDRSIMAPGLLAQVVVGKYVDHLPLYRQEQIFKQRYGVHLGRNTLCRGVELVADSLQLIAKQMFCEQLSTGYVQLDETPVQYLCKDKGSAKGYFWVSNDPQGDTVYHWAPGRGYEHLKRWVPPDFKGIIQTDEYATYNKLKTDRNLKAHAHCWAHVRRRFVKALEMGEHPARLRWIVHQIGLLYRIEQRLRDEQAGPTLRAAIRASESRPILERLFRLWDRMYKAGKIKPKSLTGTAIAYALRQQEGLQVYVEHGQVEIDNNLVENAIRPAALGRKNWLFIGDKEAGWRSAVVYTILQSCKTYGIDPYAYLKDVLERLPHMTNQQIDQLTPRAWIGEQQRSMKLAS